MGQCTRSYVQVQSPLKQLSSQANHAKCSQAEHDKCSHAKHAECSQTKRAGAGKHAQAFTKHGKCSQAEHTKCNQVEHTKSSQAKHAKRSQAEHSECSQAERTGLVGALHLGQRDVVGVVVGVVDHAEVGVIAVVVHARPYDELRVVRPYLVPPVVGLGVHRHCRVSRRLLIRAERNRASWSDSRAITWLSLQCNVK